MSEPRQFLAVEDLKRALAKSAAKQAPLLDPTRIVIPESGPIPVGGTLHVYSGTMPTDPNVPPDQSRLRLSHVITVRQLVVEPWWLRWWRRITG